jgi:hypothetical protein
LKDAYTVCRVPVDWESRIRGVIGVRGRPLGSGRIGLTVLASSSSSTSCVPELRRM